MKLLCSFNNNCEKEKVLTFLVLWSLHIQSHIFEKKWTEKREKFGKNKNLSAAKL